MKNRGLIIVLSAPSGAGKSTIYKQLIKKVPKLAYSVSYTTRSPRPGEKNGRDYFFVSEDGFNKLKKHGEFIEWARVHDNFYGTSKNFIKKTIDSGKSVILDIDVQGAVNLRKLFPDALLIFVMAPSFKELEKRLRARKKDSEAVIKKRLVNARKELKYLPHYDYLVINDKINRAVKEIETIIQVERSRLSRISK